MALRPWTEGWPCRSKLPAGGSTPPRRHCSLAGRRAGRLRPRPRLGPEELPDLGAREAGQWLQAGDIVRVLSGFQDIFTASEFQVLTTLVIVIMDQAGNLLSRADICQKGNEPSTTCSGRQVRNLLLSVG